jgi:hypothetical protein
MKTQTNKDWRRPQTKSDTIQLQQQVTQKASNQNFGDKIHQLQCKKCATEKQMLQSIRKIHI